MMKGWLSRYNLRYLRSLVYMLQASEYNIHNYLAWYHKTKNFSNIENRKRLVKTTKVRLLFIMSWLTIILFLSVTISLIWPMTSLVKFISLILGVFFLPYILAYGIIIPLLIIEIMIQRPVEYLIFYKVRRKLKTHNAVKIGIAGSFGKTTMREILKVVLSEGKKVASPPHSHNTPLGISEFVKTLKGDEDVLIFEFGEYYQGDIKKLCSLVQPDMGIITGINEAHLEKFKTLERTTKTIYELADYLDNKPLYVNGENKLALYNARSKHIIYSRQGLGDWKIKDMKTDLDGTSFIMEKGNFKFDLKSKLLGLHQIGPLIVAINIAFDFGFSINQIESGVKKTKPYDHRLEPKIDNIGVITLDDSYNGNPDGVKAVIEFLTSLKDHRRFYVTPGLVEMGTRTKEVHRQIGESLAKASIEKVVLIRNSVTSYIEDGLKKKGYGGEVLWFEDSLSAFTALPHLTAKGDIVLLQNDWPDQYQ
jgi:UDP-N-acetylmuramoyl-tripeptide--D-alanyl-D-alanine ligase